MPIISLPRWYSAGSTDTSVNWYTFPRQISDQPQQQEQGANMPFNTPSTDYFHSWAAILSQSYGHEDITPPASVERNADIQRLAAASDLPCVLTYWPHHRDRAPQMGDETTFAFGELEVTAAGRFYEDFIEDEPEAYTPIMPGMRVGDRVLFENMDDALMSMDGYYTMSYCYNATREQIRFHLLFDPRTIAFRDVERRGSETIPARRVLMRVETIMRELILAHSPSWTDSTGQLSEEFPCNGSFFLEPDPAQAERLRQELEDRQRQQREEEERQRAEREALIDRLASSFSHSRHDNRQRLESQLENILYDINSYRRSLRDLEEKYHKTLQEIMSLGHQSVEDLKSSIRAYADSIDLEKLIVQPETIHYTVDRFELYHNGQHDGFEYAEIGPFKISLDRQTLALSVHSVNGGTPETTTRMSRGGHIHPHVSSDGLVCWGGSAPDSDTPSGRDLVRQIMQRRNMFELLFYAVDFFKRGYYSGDAYEQLSGWVEDPHQDEWYCDHCEVYHPNGSDCPNICQDCGEYVDWEVHRYCPEHGCYDMQTATPSRDPADYESAHEDHCPTCIEEREEREREEREERERQEREEREREREREAREQEIAAAEDAADAQGGNVTLTPDDIESDQEQEEQEQEQEQEEPDTADIPF
jgi:hypothetical protein